MRKRLLGKVAGGVRVYEVDGPSVRRQHVEFVQGGHGRVYPWIPKNEIWVERMRDAKDEVAIAAHEINEYIMMRDYGANYRCAHTIANGIEQKIRRRMARSPRQRRRR